MNNNEAIHFDQTDLVGFWKRVLVAILDIIVLAIPGVLLYWMFNTLAESLQSEIPIIVQNILFFVFNIFMIVRFGGSPGKLILKMRIVNEQGYYPTLRQALVRNSFQVLSVIFSMIIEVSSFNFTVISTTFSLWADMASTLSTILAPIILVDYLFVAFHPRKRALHDMMAGTYVVYK